MTPAVVAGNPRAHVYAVIDHDRHCPHATAADAGKESPSPDAVGLAP